MSGLAASARPNTSNWWGERRSRPWTIAGKICKAGFRRKVQNPALVPAQGQLFKSWCLNDVPPWASSSWASVPRTHRRGTMPISYLRSANLGPRHKAWDDDKSAPRKNLTLAALSPTFDARDVIPKALGFPCPESLPSAGAAARRRGQPIHASIPSGARSAGWASPRTVRPPDHRARASAGTACPGH